jgi:hypothetical protein
MRIYTSSWFQPLPDTIQKIGISRGYPRGYPAGYRRMMELAPGTWFNSVSPAEYHRLFMEQLSKLHASDVVEKITKLSAGKDVALLCFEKPSDPTAWCHRGQVSGWLHDELGIEVREFGLESAGCGWRHPKLHQDISRNRGSTFSGRIVDAGLGEVKDGRLIEK